MEKQNKHMRQEIYSDKGVNTFKNDLIIIVTTRFSRKEK